MPSASNGNPLCGTDWGQLLKDEFEKPYWAKLTGFVGRERLHRPVYPPANEVFRALQLTWCQQTKVVIVGQDPYYRLGEAHGLCFSIPCGVTPPRSLEKIHLEMETDQKITPPNHGSLEPWAHRGVLLLNTTLTVAHGKPGSHQGKGWEDFTDEVIRVAVKESDPVFLLWGRRLIGRKDSLLGSAAPRAWSSSHRTRRHPRATARAAIAQRSLAVARSARRTSFCASRDEARSIGT